MKNAIIKNQWYAFFLLTAAGLITNFFPFTLHYRVDLMFGGIFALLAACTLPVGRSILSAAIISLPTYYLWNHPLGICLYTFEAILIILMLKKTRFQLLTSSIFVWVLFFPPVLWLVMNYSNWFFPSAIRLFILKYCLNGIFNAAVASLLIMFFQLGNIHKNNPDKKAGISEIAVNLMLILTIIPLLVFTVLDSRLLTSEILNRVQCRHRSMHNSIQTAVRQWLEQKKQTLHSVAGMRLNNIPDPGDGQTRLQLFLDNRDDFHSIEIFDRTGKKVLSGVKQNCLKTSDNPYLQQILHPQGCSDSHDPDLKKHAISIGVPLIFNNVVAGYICGKVHIDTLIVSLKEMNDSSAGFFINDSQGATLLSVNSDESLKLRKQSFKKLPVQGNLKMLQPADDLIASKRFLMSRLCSETQVKGFPDWRIIVEEPMAGLIENLFSTSFSQFSYIFLLIIILFTLSPIIQKSIATPLKKLAENTSQLKKNSVVVPESIPTSNIFEIHQLAENFSAAVSAIAEAREKDKIQTENLEKTNAKLEEKIEQLKIAHFKAEKAEKSFAVLVSSSPFVVIMADRKGRIEFFNSALQELTGIKKEFSTINEIFECLKPYEETPFPVDDFINFFNSSHEVSKKTFSGELSFYRANEVGIVNCIATMIENQCIIIMHDITQISLAKTARKKLEEQVQANQKLESLGILAGGVAHDFNNILLSILGYAELTLLEMPVNNRLRNNIEMIESAAQRAAKLTMQILAYTGNRNYVSRPFELTAITRDMLSMLSVSIPNNINIVCNLDGELNCTGDSTQIGQIIMNLLINASEAIGENPGQITVTTGKVSSVDAHLKSSMINYTSENNKSYAFLEVTDTGCGIKTEDMSKIFDPFFSTKFTGRGLGLAASMGTVKAHHGAIFVSSKPGRGACFRLMLPESETVPQSPVIDFEKNKELHLKGKILLVDDEETVLSITGLMLENLKVEIITAADGIEAVEKFKDHHSEISLVILDMVMPRMKGEEAFIKMKAINPGIPIIVSSGFTREETLSRLSDVTVEGFMQKPFKRNDLINEIARVIEKA